MQSCPFYTKKNPAFCNKMYYKKMFAKMYPPPNITTTLVGFWCFFIFFAHFGFLGTFGGWNLEVFMAQ